MDNILIFAGTTEGRHLAEFLAENEVPAHVCVATEYGEQLLPQSDVIQVHAGRLDTEAMQKLMEQEQITLVVDATHPYAVAVSENIREACADVWRKRCETAQGKKLHYIRLERRESASMTEKELLSEVVFADSVQEAARFLAGQTGNILAATGSKELAAYTVIPDYEKRVFARVLSTAEVAAQCAALGFTGKNLICMQGPFSEELNAAMLQQTNAAWMVTKEAGKAGGFEEKLRAARRAGARLVLVRRPEGKAADGGEENKAAPKGFDKIWTGDEMEVRRLLCEQLGLHPRQRVFLVGIGMGSEKNMTVEAREACERAQLLIGAQRMLACACTEGKAVFSAYRPAEIAEYIKSHPQYGHIAVLLSGDIGFYSGAKGLYDAIERADTGKRIEIVPCCGISSVVYFCGRLHTSWEDVKLVSLHGRSQNLIAAVAKNRKVFALCGEMGGVNAVCRQLMEYGLGKVRVSVGTDLSYEEECIVTGTAEELSEKSFAKLSVLLIENDAPDRMVSYGMEDEAFLRAKVPMTKSEVRSISLSKLQLEKDSVVYDIGAGTGSVSVEMARLVCDGWVYAVEKKQEAVSLICENKRKWRTDNLTVVEGLAPEALFGLPLPTHAFIGGSSGNLREIMELLLQKNPRIRIVINAIALETVAEAVECLKLLPVDHTDVVCVSVAKAKTAGSYHMMMGQNPVYILSCTGAGGEPA